MTRAQWNDGLNRHVPTASWVDERGVRHGLCVLLHQSDRGEPYFQPLCKWLTLHLVRVDHSNQPITCIQCLAAA